MGHLLSREDIQEALELSANNKAPGPNGIPYEVFKIINAWYETSMREGEPGFNVIKILQLVFKDMEKYGVCPGTSFSESWMCPLYKKNDRVEIANYRPISLLNTNYKIMTKALAIKLAWVAPSLIHSNQAGFVPGRNIYDQIWLTKCIIDLAEVEEQNEMIIFLDQEKAYDKIEHDYLWRILSAYKIPELFISSVKSLYSDAYTTVYINGVASSTPFHITCGVCQGDPLLCLLFDLAIEPLAEMLQQPDLQSFNMPGVEE